jgi:hypothetical protein
MTDEAQHFFAVMHTFSNNDEAENWWAEMADADLATAAKMQHERGIFAHYCLPSTISGPMLCVWECLEPTTAEELTAFIQGPAQPAGSPDALSSRVYAIDAELGGLARPSAWPHTPPPTAESTGSFFWCTHTFEFDAAAEAFFALTSQHPVAALESPMPELIHHHMFLATGATATDVAFSVWETREPIEVDEFHAFIDGPQSPLVGTTSVVHPVGASGTPPAAAFPRKPKTFANAMMMPLMSDTMNIWNTMLPFKLTREEEEEQVPAASASTEASAVEKVETVETIEAVEDFEEETPLVEQVEALMPLKIPGFVRVPAGTTDTMDDDSFLESFEP